MQDPDFMDLPFGASAGLVHRGTKSFRDPFLIKFLTECSKHASGVWGQTAAMDAIFSGSMDEIAKFCGRPDLLGGRNAFGQTTIHLAVPRPRVLKKIIKAGIPLDVLDDKGRTPLFYAAAYDTCQFWDTVTCAVQCLNAKKGLSDEFLREEIYRMVEWAFFKSTPEIEVILKCGIDPNFILFNGETFLHRALNGTQVDALFKAGFEEMIGIFSGGTKVITTSMISLSVPYEYIGTATSIAVMALAVGGSVGTTIYTALLLNYNDAHLPAAVAQSAKGLSETSLESLLEVISFEDIVHAIDLKEPILLHSSSASALSAPKIELFWR